MLVKHCSEYDSVRTIFQAQIAVLVVKVITAHGAVELVVGIHLVGVGVGGGGDGELVGRSQLRLLLQRRLFCRTEVVVCLVCLPLVSGSGRRRGGGQVPPDDGTRTLGCGGEGLASVEAADKG